MPTTLVLKTQPANLENIYAAIKILESKCLDGEKTKANKKATIEFLCESVKSLLDRLFVDGKDTTIKDIGFAFDCEYNESEYIKQKKLMEECIDIESKEIHRDSE
jgi:hypothetical protein